MQTPFASRYGASTLCRMRLQTSCSILQQHFEEQIQELNKEVSALGFEPTIVSLEPCL